MYHDLHGGRRWRLLRRWRWKWLCLLLLCLLGLWLLTSGCGVPCAVLVVDGQLGEMHEHMGVSDTRERIQQNAAAK